MNDTRTVLREYATEDRFLARRLDAQAVLEGPLVEVAALAAVTECNPRRILDVGCGTGDFSERVARDAGAPVVGLDLSHRMAEITHRRGLRAIIADAQRLPFADGSFDCVLANRVLYHLPDLAAGVSEIARVLAPGARLVAVTYGARHLQELWDMLATTNPSSTSTFSSRNGEAALRSSFGHVERYDLSGAATFTTRESILSLLGAFGELSDIDLGARLGHVATPFAATYRHTLFVARKYG